MVHGDIRPWNFVATYAPPSSRYGEEEDDDGAPVVSLKIHDFNAARFLSWNNTTTRGEEEGRGGGLEERRRRRHRCSFDNTVCNINRSPEECNGEPQDEKIDVYGLGNVILYVLTLGDLTPYGGLAMSTADREDLARRGISPLGGLRGELRVSDHPAIRVMRRAVTMCHGKDPRGRADAVRESARY